ncbi:MAG: OmpA family protein [Alphaproteobacteria bacterium]|nr:OmpA family protein [Alphaproteobacteria bacterium]
MNMLRNLFLITAMIALGGCTVFTSFSEVEALNEAQAVGSPFTTALASEYRDYSNSELKQMFDYPDALHFARKGLAAASGEAVLPEPVGDWNLSDTHIAELSAARGRLIVAYDLGARETSPELAAKTQAKFDCWIEQQEESWKEDAAPACKAEFMELMAQLESGLQAPAVVSAPVAEPMAFDVDPNAPMAPENAVYLVFFDWDKADLGSGALNVLDAVADEIANNPPESVTVVGHTDTSGATDYNQRLAFKRANAVRDALVERGVNPSMISVDAKGESELLVETPDNVREPANRRVNISFN